MSCEFGSRVRVTLFGQSHGEAVGAVILLSREEGARMGETEIKVAETAAGFIGRQMEQ